MEKHLAPILADVLIKTYNQFFLMQKFCVCENQKIQFITKFDFVRQPLGCNQFKLADVVKLASTSGGMLAKYLPKDRAILGFFWVFFLQTCRCFCNSSYWLGHCEI